MFREKLDKHQLFCVLKMTLKRARYCNNVGITTAKKKKALELQTRLVPQKRSDMIIRTNTKPIEASQPNFKGPW